MMNFQSSRFADDPVLVAILNDRDTGTRKLQPGSNAESVKRLQQALWDLWWVNHVAPEVLHDDFVIGIYGPKTMQAVKAYKTRYDIHFPPDAPTGFIDEFAGPRTFARLDGHCVQLDTAVAAILSKMIALRADNPQGFNPNKVPTSLVIPIPGTQGCKRQIILSTAGGQVGGDIYFQPETGAFEVHGLISNFYRENAGGPSGALGFPVSDEEDAGPGRRRSRFQGGELVCDLASGAVTQALNGVTVNFGDPKLVF
jgi:hypothetical protein